MQTLGADTKQTCVRACVHACVLCCADISITKLLEWHWTCYWKWLFSWWRKRKLTSSCCCAWKCGLKWEHGVFSASLFNPSKWLTGWHEWFTTTETSSENRQNRSWGRGAVEGSLSPSAGHSGHLLLLQETERKRTATNTEDSCKLHLSLWK